MQGAGLFVPLLSCIIRMGVSPKGRPIHAPDSQSHCPYRLTPCSAHEHHSPYQWSQQTAKERNARPYARPIVSHIASYRLTPCKPSIRMRVTYASHMAKAIARPPYGRPHRLTPCNAHVQREPYSILLARTHTDSKGRPIHSHTRV